MPINEALFWFGLTAFGTGLYFLFEATVKRLYSIGVTVIGFLACAYAEYRHYHPQFPAIRLWVILLVLTWALLGYNIYIRRVNPGKTSKLVVHWANYRAVEGGGEEFQVGDFLRQIISGDSLVLDIENHNFVIGDKNFVPRDPLWGKEKRLQVNYSFGGNPPVTTERREHGRLLLPEDSKIKWLMGEVERLESAQAKPSQHPLAPLNPVKVSLVPWKGKGEKMFLTVTNLGAQHHAFQGQCRVLARRNDPNTPQLLTFDLQWEYGGRSYTLGPGQAGNLLIASAGHSEHKEMEWLQLESAGLVKPQRSDWNFGDKLPQYDIEVSILGDGEPQREKFTVRAGKECAIEMEEYKAPTAIAQPLASRVFELAKKFRSESQGFLAQNPRPDIPTRLRGEGWEGTVATFLDWKHRFAGWFRSQFSSQLQQVRDELAARGLRDQELDSALSDMSAMSQSTENIDLIVTKLRFLASGLEE
jgi:hypothetical protein